MAAVVPLDAKAQTTSSGSDSTDATVLPPVTSEAASPNTLRAPIGVSRMPGTVQDTPQTVNVIPQEVLRQQNVTTLEEALRNVPGITTSIGEGNGGVNGDQFRIRGFNAQNDLYVDGLREFGAYQRDTFNTEQIEVISGPSGFALGGAGTVGGAVNLSTRLPHLGNSYGAVVTGGMGPFARGVGDVNVQLTDSIAARIVVMGQSSELVDRDGQDTDKWGIAPSIAFGLGTGTTVTIDYLHYQYDKATDYGVPVVTPTGAATGKPVTEYGLRRANWYGIDSDRDEVKVDRITARISHRATDWLTLSSDTRLGYATRDFATTVPSCNTACIDSFLAGGDPTVTLTGGGRPLYTQDNWGIQNITQATARFRTGSLRHELIAGIDASYENTKRTGYTSVPTLPSTTFLRTPNNNLSRTAGSANNERETDTTSFAVFLSERLWITPELSILGGLRWTNYKMNYTAGTPGAAPTTDVKGNDTFIDPRASIIFEPTPSQTYYATWSRSSTPPGINFTTVPGGANGANAQRNADSDPEENTLYEIGAKIGLFDNRLGLSAALFRIEKENATETDPTTGDVFATSDKQRNQGFQIGATGRITPAWNINANYIYMDSEIRESTTAANVGNRVAYVPKHAVSLWTTYDINQGEAWNLTVGGGITWRSKAYLNAANSSEVPSQFSLDALLSHQINENLRVSVNGYNLTDETNYAALFGNRVVVAPGRTVLVSVGVDF